MQIHASSIRIACLLAAGLGLFLPEEAEAQYRRPPKVRINRSKPPSQQRTEAMNKFLDIIKELDTLISGIKTKEDADKAAGALVDIHNRIINLNAEVIQTPMNLQEFNSVNRTFGRQVESAFQKLEKTMGHLKNKKFHNSKALVYALSYGMSHPYYRGNRLNGEPILNAYHGNTNDDAYKKAEERTMKHMQQRGSIPPDLVKQYQQAFNADSGRQHTEFIYQVNK